jgi:hypothetical protein
LVVLGNMAVVKIKFKSLDPTTTNNTVTKLRWRLKLNRDYFSLVSLYI